MSSNNLLTIREASQWATQYLDKPISASNISYLIQYGKISKIKINNELLINIDDLTRYYKAINQYKESNWKDKLGHDLNWALSFSQYKESETTKHVHRLHPYKGKFIPQLVEYFLDSHIDDFKKESFFKSGDIILDPFCGSGTTLVESNELGMHAVGIDISAFNALISNSKLYKYNINDIKNEADRISKALKKFLEDKKNIEFENELLNELKVFNDNYFPSPDFRKKVAHNEIDEKKYGFQKEAEFLPIYKNLIKKFNIDLETGHENFLDKWFLKTVRDEIYFTFEQIKTIQNKYTKIILSIVLSRTIRSCRATTHSDLATLINPVTSTYYCKKHGKICKPLFSIYGWWDRYAKDTIKRIIDFKKIRTNTYQKCLTGDSRVIDIITELKLKNDKFGSFLDEQKFAGIFSSPPYVGLIDYHEQHAYSYDLFGFTRRDDLEIGPLFNGQGKEARESYVEGIAAVLNNCKRFLADNYNVFLVANDKYNLYPLIAEKSGMSIVDRFKRPVLNRTERDKAPYSETIFHLKRRDKK